MAAPKNNQFYKLALKALGAPRKYETYESLYEVIIGYFEDQREKVKPHYTVTGLYTWCGFSDKKAFVLQADRGEDFFTLIKTALNIVASCYENNLYTGNPAGAIFALKNMKSEEFKDKTEIDQTIREQPLFPDEK
jgi:hypothetical protein